MDSTWLRARAARPRRVHAMQRAAAYVRQRAGCSPLVGDLWPDTLARDWPETCDIEHTPERLVQRMYEKALKNVMQ